MEFIIENIGLIGLVLIILAIFNKYRNINSSKNKENIEEKELNSFQKWWQQSYIKEIYFVRTKQRIVISLIPLVGFFVSIFVVFWSIIGLYNTYMYPTQPFEKLIKYEGIIKSYSYHRKSLDVLSIELPNKEIKNFSLLLENKKIMDSWINKNAILWVQNKGSIIETYDVIQVIDLEGITVFGDKEYDRKLANKRDIDRDLSNLISSLKLLIGFLFLLWFINIKPVNNNIEHSQLKIAIVSILGVVLFFVSILIFLVLGTH
jgi:hypothetical protein